MGTLKERTDGETGQSKDIRIGIRIDPEMKEMLESFSGENIVKKMTLSEKVRKALGFWMSYNTNKSIVPDSDYSVLSINLLRYALNCMNEEQLHQLSLQAYHNSLGTREFLKNNPEIGNLDFLRQQYPENATGRIENLIVNVYGPEGYRWFDEITVVEEIGKIRVQGTHRLGENFNRFFFYHITNNLQEFAYEITEERSSKIKKKNDSQIYEVEITLEKSEKFEI